jgi:hypothetical protein
MQTLYAPDARAADDVGLLLQADANAACAIARTDSARLPLQEFNQEASMKIMSSLFLTASLLSGCISSSSPPPPAKTTVVVPPNSSTTVVCQDGTRPPCG